MVALRRLHILAVLSVLLLPAHVSIAGGTYNDTKEALEEAVSELKNSLDDLDDYHDDLGEQDLSSVLASIRSAKTTMRSTACSLLLASINHNRPDDFGKVLKALKILHPEIYDRTRGPK